MNNAFYHFNFPDLKRFQFSHDLYIDP